MFPGGTERNMKNRSDGESLFLSDHTYQREENGRTWVQIAVQQIVEEDHFEGRVETQGSQVLASGLVAMYVLHDRDTVHKGFGQNPSRRQTMQRFRETDPVVRGKVTIEALQVHGLQSQVELRKLGGREEPRTGQTGKS